MASRVQIDRIGNEIGAPRGEIESLRRRKELHAASAYEAERATFAGIGKQDLSAIKAGAGVAKAPAQEKIEPVTLRTRAGLVLEMPQMSSDDRRSVQQIWDEMPAEKVATVRELA